MKFHLYLLQISVTGSEFETKKFVTVIMMLILEFLRLLLNPMNATQGKDVTQWNVLFKMKVRISKERKEKFLIDYFR